MGNFKQNLDDIAARAVPENIPMQKAIEAPTDFDVPAYQRQGKKLIDPKAESAANRFGESLGGMPLPKEAPEVSVSPESLNRLEMLANKQRPGIEKNPSAVSAFDVPDDIAQRAAEGADKILASANRYPKTRLEVSKEYLGSVQYPIKDMSDQQIIETAERLKDNLGGNSKLGETLKRLSKYNK